MEGVILFCSGFLFGALAMRWVLTHAEHIHLRPHERDPHYAPAVRAVQRHFRRHGTVNLSQLEQMLSINGMTAMRYLDQMERDGILKLHGHRGKKDSGQGAFYTKV